ncbi:MAG: hypothetical protein Hens2KO_19300 [Henriciella sp.]
MPQNASAAALKALTEWWEDMGVEVDQAGIARSMQAQTRANTGPAPAAPYAGASETQAAPSPGRKSRKSASKTLHDWIQEAESLAAGADSIEALKAAIESFDGCPLKQLCEKTVVYDGTIGAPVMVLGEGPGGQEDRLGLPFVGKAGQLLDKMLAAIQLDAKPMRSFPMSIIGARPAIAIQKPMSLRFAGRL